MKTDRMNDELAEQEPAPDGCDPGAILKELHDAFNDTQLQLQDMQAAADVRHCRWDGQSADGRKHAVAMRAEPFPFEGASDARIRACEEIIRENWLVLMAAVFRSKAAFRPRQLTDESRDSAHKMESVMKYFLSGPMRREVRDVLALAFDWMLGYGLSVVHCSWHERRQLQRASVTGAGLVQWAVMKGASAMDETMRELEDDPAMEPELDAVAESAVVELGRLEDRIMLWLTDTSPASLHELTEVLREYDPGMQNARKVARMLQAEGAADYFTAVVVESRPRWEALLPGVDVLFPPETRDLKTARWVARVRWMTASEVKAAAAMEGWDEDWTQKVLQRPGKAFDYNVALEWALGGGGVSTAVQTNYRDTEGFQIVEVWQRTVTPDGVPFIRKTLVHECDRECYGMDDIYAPQDGNLPFFEMKRQHNKRLLWESEGIAAEMQSEQDGIKCQFDARVDHTSLSISPPMIKPPSLAGAAQTGRVRPGGELVEFRDGTIRFMDVRGDSAKSIEIERAIWERIARRYGRMDATVPAALSQLHMDVLVQNALTDLTEVLRHTVGLVQEFMPDLVDIRMNEGAALLSARGRERALTATREEIGGVFEPEISFDVRDMDLEWLREKLSLLAEIAIPLDSQAVIDRGQIVRLILDAVDPRLESAAMDGEQAAMNEEMDELTMISIIVAGEEPPFVQGQNHALRAQVMRRAVQRSPRLDAIIRADPQVAKVFEARLAMHDQQVTQDQNRVIGRLGAASVLDAA